MRFPVYLTSSSHKDRGGNVVNLAERCLVPRSPQDRVIAVVEAPKGARIRRKRDQHGPDQLIVPLGISLWERLFGMRTVIPAKYLLGDARRKAYGLSVVETYSEALSG